MEDSSAAMTVDARGLVTGWSDGARRLTGHAAEEVVGRPARDLLARGAPTRPLSRADPAGTALSGTVVVRHRDGRPVSLGLRIRPLRGADGAPGGYLATADVPGGPAPALIDDAVRQASLSMSVLDPELRFVHVNDTACRMMGRPAEELLGRSLSDTLADFEGDPGASCTTCGWRPTGDGPSSTRAMPRRPRAAACTPGPWRSGRSTMPPARSPPSPWRRWRAPNSTGPGSGWPC